MVHDDSVGKAALQAIAVVIHQVFPDLAAADPRLQALDRCSRFHELSLAGEE